MTPIYDGNWRLQSYDPESGRTVWMMHDGDKTHFRIDYPVDDIIEANRQASLAADGTRWGDYARVASIPLNIFHQNGISEALKQEDSVFLKRWLNDGDNRAWRTREGKI